MKHFLSIVMLAISIGTSSGARGHRDTRQDTGFVDVPVQGRHESYYDYKTQNMGEFSVPVSVQVKRYRLTLSGGSFTAELVLGGDLARGGRDRLMYEIYFAKPGLSYEIGLVAPVGNTAYPSTPILKPGKAGLVDVLTGRLIATANVSIQGNRLTISCRSAAFAGKHVTFGLVRYAPRSLTDSRVSYGNECIVQVYHEAPELREYKKQLPSHPAKH